MHADIKELKKQTRAAALSRRDALSQDMRAEKSLVIAARLISLDIFQKARCVFVYVAVRSEVCTHAIILAAQEQGKRVCVPLIEAHTKRMIPCEIRDPVRDLYPGMLGIPEPDPRICPPVAVHDIGLAVIPGLAFTLQGQRIGYGGGFYDRFLGEWRGTSYALAFEELIVESLPFDPSRDRAVSCIITESRVIDCSGSRIRS